MALRRFLAPWLLFALGATAQEQDPPPRPKVAESLPARYRAMQRPKPAAPAADPRLARAAADLRAAAAHLQTHDVAFDGLIYLPLGKLGPWDGSQRAVAFAGAQHDDLLIYRCHDFQVVVRDRTEVTKKGDGPWTKPQGDAPDCPLSPRAFAAHLPTSTVDAWRATSFEDRPAVAVHLEWRDTAAKDLLANATAAPDSRSSQLLDALASFAGDRDPSQQLVLDAIAFVDPATKTLYAATLRLAVVDRSGLLPIPETPPPAQRPELPPLAHPVLAEIDWVLTIAPAATMPLPELDAAARARLGLE